jgi:chemotaxis protein MotB
MRVGILLLAVSVAACSNKGLIIDQQKEQIDFLNEENELLQRRVLELDEKLRVGSMGTWQVVGTLIADSCFVDDSARLNLEGVRQMEAIADRLRDAYESASIRIEGFSEKKVLSDDVKDDFPSTWELTSARASMIARHLQWTHEFDPSQIEVVGYGHYRSAEGAGLAAGEPVAGVVRIMALK